MIATPRTGLIALSENNISIVMEIFPDRFITYIIIIMCTIQYMYAVYVCTIVPIHMYTIIHLSCSLQYM